MSLLQLLRAIVRWPRVTPLPPSPAPCCDACRRDQREQIREAIGWRLRR